MKIKDLYFDIPKAHSIKNLITGIFSHDDEKIYEPSHLRTHRNYYLFNRDPYVLTVLESINDLQIFSKIIGKNKDVIYLKFFSWTLFDSPGILERTIFDHNNQIKKFPRHKIIFLLNTPEEFRYFESKGINCRFINHNAFVDPNIFKPIDCQKKYDIIYNGRLEMVKRHYLLKSCKNISLLSAPVLRSDDSKIKYLNFLKGIIPNAEILNFDFPKKLNQLSSFKNIPILSPRGVCKAINKAKIGAILSYKEGACYASIEYLLSGIPIISTANIGGRDIFFDNRFCKTSLSNSYSIKKTVSNLLRDNISSDFIRSVTLNNIQLHINKMKQLIDEIFLEYGVLNANIDDVWEKIYLNKMLKGAQKFPDNFKKDL